MNPELTKGTLSTRMSGPIVPVVDEKKIIDEINTSEPNQKTLYKIVEVIQKSKGSESWYDEFKQALYNWVDAQGEKPLFKSMSDVDAFISRIKQGNRWRAPRMFLEHEKRRTILDKIKGNEEITLTPLLKRSLSCK